MKKIIVFLKGEEGISALEYTILGVLFLIIIVAAVATLDLASHWARFQNAWSTL